MSVEASIVCVILLTSAFVQAALGFGFALVAMSLLALFVDVVHAAGVVNIAGSVLVVGMSLALRRGISWSYVAAVAPWAAVGVLVGVWALGALDPHVAVRILGVSTFAIAVWNLSAAGGPGGTSRLWEAAAGLGSGVLTGAFNQGGPPLIAHLYRRPFSPETMKGTAQLIFLVTGLVRLPTAAAHGQLTTAVWQQAAFALPFVGLGLVGGLRVSRHLDGRSFHRLAWSALALLGVYLTAFP